MEIRYFNNVKFVKSITNIKDRPAKILPEIAFVGRSNVGKSSLLNAICNRKSIAKISSVPGKTRLINYFEINETCYFVDLPGYGYSKTPKAVRDSWANMMEEFLKNSDHLRLVCLLVDSRHGLLENDNQMINWLNYYQIPFTIILTKSDKISKSKIQNLVNTVEKQMPDNRTFSVSINSENSILKFNNYLYSLLSMQHTKR